MRLFVRQVAGIFFKDLVSELREGHHFLSILLFGLLLLLLFSFALSVDPELMRRTASGLFWLAIFFSSTLVLQHSFQRETEDGQWEGLLLQGTDPRAFYLGKLLANLGAVAVTEIVLLFLMTILFELTLTPTLFFVLSLGSFGIATLGTFYAGLTATFRQGPLLLPLLLFPMLVPVLLSSVKATELAMARDVFGQQIAWLKLLIVFDSVFLFGALLFADTLFDGQ